MNELLLTYNYFAGCEIGFYESGSVCLPCRFLHYGYGCQMKCDCLEKDCHHVYGCENTSAGYFLLIEKTLTLHMCNLHNFQIDKVFPINAKKRNI